MSTKLHEEDPDINLQLYPFQSKYFNFNSHKIHYIDEGSGEPVVLVHGNPTWSFYYRSTIKTLSPFCRVIAPDHVGMGLSDKPISGYSWTLKQRVADFAAFIDHLELKEKITLVVHDWGGAIAFSWAVENPDRVKRIIVLNSAAFTMPATKRFPLPLYAARFPILGYIFMRYFNVFAHSAIYFGAKKKATR